jgi:4-aminobutyrate aminotransferase-like enzyme/Ser/Thr protein kinase RdoA (MazF antagonist)
VSTESADQPGPGISLAQAAELLEAHWSISGELSDVGSYEDQNVRVRADGRSYVLKIDGQDRSRTTLQREHDAMRHLAGKDIGYELPVPIGEIVGVNDRHLRLLSWVAGSPLTQAPYLNADALADLGALVAASAAGLQDFDPPPGDLDLKWDPRLAPAVVTDLLDGTTPDQRAALNAAIRPLQELPAATADALPWQLIHCDITDFNVIWRPTADGRIGLTGLIDFGDLSRTWRVCDLACTCVAMVARDAEDAIGAMTAVLGGYLRHIRLLEAEVDALWPLILARAAACAAISIRHLGLKPGSEYLTEQYRGDSLAMDALLALAPGLPTAALRATSGLPAVPRTHGLAERLAAADPIPPIADLPARPIDLGVGSDALHDGAWEDPARVHAVIHSAKATIGRWGEAQLTRSGAPSHRPPATLHLGTDLFAEPGTHVRSPLGAEVVSVGDREVALALELDGDPVHVRLTGIEPVVSTPFRVARGGLVGHVAERTDRSAPHVHVQLIAAPGPPGSGAAGERQAWPAIPGLGCAREREAWLALCPDPSPLIGAATAAPPPVDAGRRAGHRLAHVADAQELYYERPMEIVRGWRQYLYDADGRPYLDMINNVAVVGHSHPRIADAAGRQYRLLNTNSRFLYDALSEYAERLSALLPAQLDTVFLVNSGSEACDLALQLARVYTGRRDVVGLAGAYHGWTAAVFEVCTSPADNPGWGGSVPPDVHVAEQPDPFRGRFGDDGAAYALTVAQACEAAAGRGGVAAFISEAMLGNQGAVTPPPGFLAAAYEAVRAAGGVCIADEVQVGFGRTGDSFWAFEHEGVVPDIVTMAKAAGNGHPVGAVVCRREIAEALRRRSAFFSSPGGGPVSCRIGLAVLDVIEDEGLQSNAKTVGAALKGELLAVAQRHPTIGAVNGRGLYQGVDLVHDRATNRPAGAAARTVCERMRELGVIVQPTGDAGNVLKIKPPLCITADDASYFAGVLDQALGELEAVLPSP